MTIPTVELRPFTPSHIPAALRLSRDEGWPHRPEDWAMTLSVSRGVVAVRDHEVLGTALCSEFGDVAAINMIIVDASLRGQGLGRRLMHAVMGIAGGREMRLTATADGLPLYEKLGFVSVRKVFQHQGVARASEPELPVHIGDAAGIADMDLAASGMDREALLCAIATEGEVLRAEGGFALLRDFGRGKVLGPLVAMDEATARALMSAGASRCAGKFLRIDLNGDALGPHAEALSLALVGGGTGMHHSARARAASEFNSYALASQAWG